jgi:hypothetical protein
MHNPYWGSMYYQRQLSSHYHIIRISCSIYHPAHRFVAIDGPARFILLSTVVALLLSYRKNSTGAYSNSTLLISLSPGLAVLKTTVNPQGPVPGPPVVYGLKDPSLHRGGIKKTPTHWPW